jgi:hypothetical protein
MLSVVTALFVAFPQTARAPATAADPYTVNVAVNEVSLTFHAADSHSIPTDDLKLSDPTTPA